MNASYLSRRIRTALTNGREVGARNYICARPGWSIHLASLMVWATLLLIGTTGFSQTIQRVSAPGKFYVDDKSSVGVVYNYAIYSISNNSGVTIPSAYVTLTDIHPTNRIQLAVTDNGVRTLGAMAPGQTRLAAFYLRGPSFTGNSDTLLNVTNETHTIQVLNGPPGVGSVLNSSGFSYTNIIFLIEAGANKVTLITNLNPLAVLGSDVTLVIAGDTGTIGGNNSISFSPGVLGSWRPDAYQLVNTVVRFTKNPTFTNQLYFDPGVSGFTNFTGQSYSNTLHFRAVKVTGTNLPVSPFVFVDSGSGTKHTTLDSLIASGGSNAIYSVTNLVSIVSHTVSPTSLLAPGGLVTYSVTFSNQFMAPINLDEIVNTLAGTPGTMTFVPGSATYNASPIVNPNIVGQTLRWAQPFTVPAFGTGTLTFQAVAPLPAGQYTNRVIGIIGGEQIDLTLDTTDNAPATSVFTLIPVSDLGVSKSASATTPAGGNFDYTLTVTNIGPSPASGVIVTDALPAVVTFVSASSGGFLSGGNVIWTNLALAASSSTTLTVTVTAPPDVAGLTNTASVSGPALDPNSTNNVVTPPVVTSVTPVADLQLIKTAPPVVANGMNFNYTLLITNRGPSSAANVAVTDALPPNVTFVNASHGGFLNAGNVLWTNLGSLAANGSLSLTLTVTAPASGGMTNTASVTSPTSDPVSTNNTTPPIVSVVGNVPPTTVNDTAATSRNTPVGVDVLANDSDANGNPLTLINVTQTNGLASVSSPNVNFTPATNFLGDVVLTYTVIDGQGGTNTGLLTISVTNRPPVAVNDIALITNGIPQVMFPLANDSDPDGDALTITSVVASSGLVTINPGATNLTFTPTNSFSGTITYTVNDGFGGSDTATILVGGNNIAPTAFNQNGVVMLEDTATNLVYTATDDDTNLLFAILGNPTNGLLSAFDANAGSVTYTPATNYFGTDSFTFTVFDGEFYATGMVSLIIEPVNDAPVTTNLNVSTPEDTGTNLVFTASDVDSTNLVFAILTGPTNGVLGTLNTNSGAVTYTPATDYFGPDGFTFTVFDGELYATGMVSIVVTPENDPPVIVNDLITVNEDSTNSIPVLLNDSDPDGDLLTLVSVSTNNGTATLSGTNVVYSPAPDFNGTNVLTYCATDGTVTNCATITVIVLPVNDAPAANNLGVTIPEDTSTNLVLTASDVDSTNLVYAILSGPTNGLLGTLNTNSGAVTYTPATNYFGSDGFTFSVFDGALYATGTVSLTITPDNDAPLAFSQSVTNLEDTALPITLTGSDVDGPITNFVLASLPTHGALTGTGANLIYTPTNNYFGPDSFTFTVNDGSLTSTVATVNITVLPVNDAPVLVNDNLTMNEDSTNSIPVLANDSDPDGDPLTIASVLTTNGTATIAGTNVVYTPSPDFNGTNVMTYCVTDGALTNCASITVVVLPVNDAPAATNLAITTPEDTGTNLVLTGSDVDNTNLVFAILTTPTHGNLGVLNPNTGAVTYAPSNNYVGPDSFTFTLFDGALYATGTVSITVTPVNDAPVANNLGVTIPEDTSTNLVLTASDVDSTNLVYAILSGPTNGLLGTLNTNSGAVTYTPATNYFGGDGFTFSVFDGALYATGTVSLTITPDNDAPLAFSQSVTNLEDTALPVTLTGSDVDGPVTNFVLVSLPTHGTLAGAGANLTYTPTNNYFGPDSFTFSVNDGSLTSAVATVSITVLPVDDPPTAFDQNLTTFEDIRTNSTLTGLDLDGDPFVFTILGVPDHGILLVNTNTGVFSYTPDTNFAGPDSFTFRANNSLTSGVATVSITVLPVNDAPTINNLTVTILEDTTLSTNVIGADVDGDTLTYGIVSKSPASSLTLNAGTGGFDYTPPANDTSTNLVLLSVFDGSLYATSTVQIIIIPVNDAPVATNDTYIALKNVTLDVSAPGVLANDFDVEGDTLFALLVTSTTNGSLSLSNNGSFVYTPSNNFVGVDSFTYRANDGLSNSAIATVTLNVLNTNVAPVATNDSYIAQQNFPLTVAAPGVLANDFDGDGNSLTSVPITAPLHGTLVLNANGSFTYTPTNDHVGADSFTYQASDGLLNSATATVLLTVIPSADVAASKFGPTNVAPGASFNYIISVTNFGPSTASNVVVADSLPLNLTFVTASGGGTFSNATVTWPTLAALAKNAGTNFTITVTGPTNGVFTNIVYSTATTADPNPTNNNGSAVASRVVSMIVPADFGVRSGTNVFNPQTGLYEQTVIVTNTGTVTAAALRLLVGDFASTNGAPRTNVWLWNAHGTNFDGRRYVQYNSPLDPGQFVSLKLEFYNPTRAPFTNSLEVQAALPVPAVTNLTGGVMIDVAFADNREPANPRFVIEWTSGIGTNYTVIYGPTANGPWTAATPSVTATATRTQWYDDGPPKTESKPLGLNPRFYRVIRNP